MEGGRLKGLLSLRDIQKNELDDAKLRLQQSLSEVPKIQAYISDLKSALQSNHEYMMSDKAPPVDDMFSWNGYRQWEQATKDDLDDAKTRLREVQEQSHFLREELINCQKSLKKTLLFIEKIETAEHLKKEEDEQNQLDDLIQTISMRRHQSP